VVQAAAGYLQQLENERDVALASRGPQQTLPLFAPTPAAPVPPAAPVAAPPSPAEERLRELDPDALSPREALSLLYELRALAAAR
jgi:DNA mismatch repair protein MutS